MGEATGGFMRPVLLYNSGLNVCSGCGAAYGSGYCE